MNRNLHILVLFLISITFSNVKAEENKFFIKIPKSTYTFENMTIVPIFTTGDFLQQELEIKELLNLKTALESEYVVISERGGELQAPGNIEDSRNITAEPERLQESVADTIQSRLTEGEIQVLLTQTRTGLSDVNNLLLTNKSDNYIYLMAGDLVKGGKQDRVIAKDIIIPPKAENINLPIFCVEQHRWGYKDDSTNFKGYSNVVSNSVGSAIQVEQEQSAVWSKVSYVQSAFGVVSETGAYTDVESSEEFQSKRKKYLEYLEVLPEKIKNMIGMIVVAGSRLSVVIFLAHIQSRKCNIIP